MAEEWTERDIERISLVLQAILERELQETSPAPRDRVVKGCKE